VHIVQNKDYVILIMYNQSNAIACLNHRAKFIFKNKIVFMYLKNM